MRSYLDRFWSDALAAFENAARPRRRDDPDHRCRQPFSARSAVARRRLRAVHDRFGDWWPKDSHHISDADAAKVILEPRQVGRWYERAEYGGECDWGQVREVDRPDRILLAWQLTPEWKFDPDPAKATEVEVASRPRRTTRA